MSLLFKFFIVWLFGLVCGALAATAGLLHELDKD